MNPVRGTPGARVHARRVAVIDVLRGFALMGILQVNIQSFVWGPGEALGYLARPPQVGESVLYFLQTALLQGKFYPIFAFVFGASMTLQRRALDRHLGGDASAAYQRRLVFLFLLGLAHGLLLYSGDVLSAYAACALVFVLLAPQRRRPFITFLGWCWLLAALSLFVPIVALTTVGTDLPPDQIPESVLAAQEHYLHDTFVGQLQQRGPDEAWQQINSVVGFWPQVVALFALGALAARMGWLHHPQRHPLVWRRARLMGLGIGLPSAVLGAALTLVRARNEPGADPQWDGVLVGLGSLLAAAYVSAIVAGLACSGLRPLYGWLADAGRMALSNYVLQSVLMGALLSGWGLGLGGGAGRAQLAALALAIFCGQLLLSRWVLRHYGQGPLEALWRRWTYG